jgi:hypothetical protein
MNLARKFLYLATGAAVLLAMSLSARPQGSTHRSTLAAGEYLNVNDALISSSGLNQAILRPDCNVVVLNGGNQVWTSYHFVRILGPCFATMQTDGNFVIYLGTPPQPTVPLWSSGTSGHSPSPFFLTMQDDGNLVIYNGTATWAIGVHTTTASAGPSTNRSTLAAGEILTLGDFLTSYSGRFQASLEDNGNFVVTIGGLASGLRGVVWTSGTPLGQGNYFAAMQVEGLFVLYKSTPPQPPSAYWVRGTYDPSPSPFFLTMQDDGNLVVYRGNLIWSQPQPVVLPPPPRPPNPITIWLAPKFNANAPNNTLYYTGTSPYLNINGNYGCSNPKVTTVLNRYQGSTSIQLNYGTQGNLLSAQQVGANQSTSVFQGDDPSGWWEAWGPTSTQGDEISLPIDVSWTC